MMTTHSKLFNSSGSYLYSEFTGKNGKWKLVGTESTEDTDFAQRSLDWTDTCIGSCLDTFKNEEGRYETKPRYKIKQLFDEGKIKPVEDSIITIKTYSSTEWNKKKGRS